MDAEDAVRDTRSLAQPGPRTFRIRFHNILLLTRLVKHGFQAGLARLYVSKYLMAMM